MSSTQIEIFGKTYHVKNTSSDVDPRDLAAFVDDKMRKLSTASPKSSPMDLAVLTALNIAQELYEYKNLMTQNQEALDQKAGALEERLNREIERIKTFSGPR